MSFLKRSQKSFEVSCLKWSSNEISLHTSCYLKNNPTLGRNNSQQNFVTLFLREKCEWGSAALIVPQSDESDLVHEHI